MSFSPEIPIINKSLSDNIVKAWSKKSLVLQCTINEPDRANITWYSPNGHDITNASRPTKEGSQLSVIILQDSDFGIYICRAENIFGFDEHKVNVTNSCKYTLSEWNLIYLRLDVLSHNGRVKKLVWFYLGVLIFLRRKGTFWAGRIIGHVYCLHKICIKLWWEFLA